jgi:hypothetical protein
MESNRIKGGSFRLPPSDFLPPGRIGTLCGSTAVIPPVGHTGRAPIADRAADLTYRLQYPLAEVNGVVYTVVSVTVPLFPVLLRLGALFAVLLVFEILLLLGSIPAGARSARRVLRPIDEMARITRNINASRLDTRLN